VKNPEPRKVRTGQTDLAANNCCGTERGMQTMPLSPFKRIAVIFSLLLFVPGWVFGDQLRTASPREHKQEGVEKRAIQEESAPEALESARAVNKTKDNKKVATALIKLLQALHLSR
jgi:hypothetical protein